MKIIKVMLSVITIVAIAAGIVAFRVNSIIIYCADTRHYGAIANTPDCPPIVNYTYIPGVFPAYSYCTDEAINEISTCSIPVDGLIGQ